MWGGAVKVWDTTIFVARPRGFVHIPPVVECLEHLLVQRLAQLSHLDGGRGRGVPSILICYRLLFGDLLLDRFIRPLLLTNESMAPRFLFCPHIGFLLLQCPRILGLAVHELSFLLLCLFGLPFLLIFDVRSLLGPILAELCLEGVRFFVRVLQGCRTFFRVLDTARFFFVLLNRLIDLIHFCSLLCNDVLSPLKLCFLHFSVRHTKRIFLLLLLVDEIGFACFHLFLLGHFHLLFHVHLMRLLVRKAFQCELLFRVLNSTCILDLQFHVHFVHHVILYLG